MERVVDGVWASAPERLPFGRSLEARAFLLEREAGNLLLYRAQTLEPEAKAIHQLGGISRQYLNHHHEASPVCDWVAATFDAPLFCHAEEESAVSATCEVKGAFSRRHTLDDDFEVVPIPGHTRGATAFLWSSGQHRCLFTGDSVFSRDGGWIAALLDGVSDRGSYIESLELVRELEFDVLVPWVATAGEPPHTVVDRPEARRRIDAIIQRLRDGEDN